MSEMEEVISVKNDFDPELSPCWNLYNQAEWEVSEYRNSLANSKIQESELCLNSRGSWVLFYILEAWSHIAACRKSDRRIKPCELLYARRLQCKGWNSAAVITSKQNRINQLKDQIENKNNMASTYDAYDIDDIIMT